MAAGGSSSGTKGSAGAVFALVLAAAGITAAIDRFGTPLPLPVFFTAVPVLAGLAVAFSGRSLVFRDVVGGPAAGDGGGAAAGTMLGAVALVAAPIGLGLGGFAGLVLIGAFLLGAVIALLGVAPALQRTGAMTVAGAVRRRFGRGAGLAAAIASLCALLALLGAEAGITGTIARQTLGLDPGRARWMIVAAATLAALAGGRRSAMLMAAALLPVIALAFLAPVSVAAFVEGRPPLPWLALFEAESYASPTEMPAAVAVVLALLLVTGLAALPTLAAPGRAAGQGRRRLWSLAAVAAVLLAAPAYALHGRVAGIDSASNPAGLVLNFAAYARIGAAPALLLAGGLLAAAAVALAAGLSAVGATLAEDVYAVHLEPGAPEGRRAFVARLSMLVTALVALALAGGGLGTATLAALGLSFAAAGLAPVLLVGWNLAAARGPAATGAIAAGLIFVLANTGLAVLAPGLGAWLGMTRIAPTVLGPTSWFGLPVGTAGAAGAVLGLAVLIALTVLGRHATRSPTTAPSTPSAEAAPVADAASPAPENQISGVIRP